MPWAREKHLEGQLKEQWLCPHSKTMGVALL